MRQPGIYLDIPSAEYHADPAINTSFLKEYANSPKKAREGERVETPAFEKGTLVHCAVLEPSALEQRYLPTNIERKNTRAWEQAERLAMGRQLVKQADFDDALRMRDAVQGDHEARELLAGVVT